MKFLFFRKMLPWSLLSKRENEFKKGSMTLISIFMFFIFSVLGLGMLYNSQIHIRLTACKKNSMLLGYASENGIKQSFNQLVQLALNRTSLSVLSSGETEVLKEDAVNKGMRIIEKLLESEIPLTIASNWEKLGWESSTVFSLKKIEEEASHFSAAYRVDICSEGMLKNFKQRKRSNLEASMNIFTGNLPLSIIPLLIDKELDTEQKKSFLSKNKIDILPSQKNKILPKADFSKDLLPNEAVPQINKALKINIFYPQDLSTSQLRSALGLEISKEPIPDGVYLIKDDMGLGGIFVQGDLDEMTMAIEDEFQVLYFKIGQSFWVLKFSPAKGKTLFFSAAGVKVYDLVPIGIVIVNGEIHSLGGGVIDSSGTVVLSREEKASCILRGVNLTIISSGRVNISSHLICQGLKWEEGIPYVKDSNSQLNIFATGKDFLGGRPRDGEIVIDENAPKEITIQASLTASGKGFNIQGEKKTVHLLGSLHASDYTSNGNRLELAFDERFLEKKDLLQNAPETVKPVLYLSSLKVIEWKED